MSKEKTISEISKELDSLNKEIISEDSIVEMVDISKRRTNLKVIIWVDGPRNIPHSDRIKFANDYGNKIAGVELIPMTIDNPSIPSNLLPKVKIKAKDIDEIKQWVILNADIIKEYGKGNIDTDTFLDLVKPVR